MPDTIVSAPGTPAPVAGAASPSGNEATFNPFAEREANNTPSTTTTTTPSPASSETPATTTQGAPGTQPTTSGTPAPTPPNNVVAQPGTPAPGISGITLTPEQLAAMTTAIRAGSATPTIPGQQPGQPTQQQPTGPKTPDQMTEQEFDQHYNVFRPNEEMLGKVFAGGPEGVKTLTEILHSTARMGATIAMRQVMGELQRYDQHIGQLVGPLAQQHQQKERDQHAAAFFKEYDGFEQKHSPILMAVYDKLERDGYRNPDPQQVYAKVAEEATKWLTSIDPNFKPKKSLANGTPGVLPGSAPVAGQPTNQPTSQMSQLVTSASAGASGASGSGGDKSIAEQIFGRRG